MVQPINYMAQIPQPDLGRSLLSGLQLGSGIRDIQQQRVAAEQAQAAKQQLAADVAAARADGSQQAWLGMIAKYPQFREAFADVRKGIGEEEVKNEFFSGFEISNALEANQPLVAIERLTNRIAALKNSGKPTGLYEQALARIEAGDNQRAQSGINEILSVLDPDRFEKTVKAKTTAAQAPAELRQKFAEAGKAESDAKTALATANNAAEVAKAELKKIEAETLAPSVREAIDFKNLSPADQAVFQNLQILKKPPAAVTNVNVSNVDKTASGELGKLVPDLYNQMNAASDLTGELARYRTALGTAITGPFAEKRLQVAQIANAFGLVGDKGINATRELIQGNAEMSLKARALIAGQGQGPITEGEQALLVKARAGDVNFTKGELNTLFNIFDRAAKAQYDQSRKLLQSATTQSPTAKLFLDAAKPFGAQTTPPDQPAAQVPPAQAVPAAAVPGMPAGFRVIR